MLYIFLKNIIEVVSSNYLCPDCGNKTKQDELSITGISSRGVDIHLICWTCNIHSHLSAEINPMTSQLLTGENGQKLFEEFIKKWGNINTSIINNKNTWINAADIAKIGEDIQNAKTIEDLMG